MEYAKCPDLFSVGKSFCGGRVESWFVCDLSLTFAY